MFKAIEVDKISAEYGSRCVLDEISFDVIKGNIHGFLGPNGAGKTTTMRLITNLMSQKSGEIKINGISNHECAHELNKTLGFLLEEPPLFQELTVHEYLLYIARLKRVSKDKLSEYVNYCIETLDLSEVKNRSIENLSKGYKQRVGIAQAIIHKPEIVILDEPTVGLDPKSVLEIRSLILKLKQNHTVLLSSHLLHEMSLVCDEVTIISNGKILATGKIDDLRDEIGKVQEIGIELLEECPGFSDYLEQNSKISSFEIIPDSNKCSYTIYPCVVEEMRHILISEGVKLGANILNVEKRQQTLEDIFISITEKND